jgi:hypothetical protein
MAEHAELPQCSARERAARQWIGLAVASLVVAGLFALRLVVGRMPPFDRLFTDPMFFRRCLVVHVNLSLVVWFHAFLVGLTSLLPGAGRRPGLRRLGFMVATTGVVLLCLSAAAPGALPILSNYVPAIDHPWFLAGLAGLGLGVALTLLDGRLLPARDEAPGDAGDPVPDAAIPGLRAAGVALLIAVLTFVASAITMPSLLPQLRYELLAWGGGHVLQVASLSAMLAAWLILLTPTIGASPLRRTTANVLFALLVLPLLVAPLIALRGVTAPGYKGAFTLLMQFGTWPVTLVILGACIRAVVVAHRSGRIATWFDVRLLAVATSAGLTVLGFVLGALIGGSNTMVPAHYHASIGAVTVAFMGVTYVLLEPLGLRRSLSFPRAVALQPVLFGVGQSIFAAGFALAGAAGMERKVYGVEQVRSATQTAGLAIMGIGGLIAVAGGLLFLAFVVAAFRPFVRARGRALASDRDAALRGGARDFPRLGHADPIAAPVPASLIQTTTRHGRVLPRS